MKKFITVDGERVQLIHNMPFDPVNGFHKTEEELMQMGILLDDVPEPERIDGKIPVPYYNTTDGFFYKYEDAPPQPANEKDIANLSSRIDYVAMMTEVM